MLFAAALTIVSVALPMSAPSIHNSNHGQVLAVPPTDDFVPTSVFAVPPTDDFIPPTDDFMPQTPAVPPTDD